MGTEIDMHRYQGGIVDRRRRLPTSYMETAMYFVTCDEMREPRSLHENLVRQLEMCGTDRTDLAAYVKAAAEYLISDRSRFAKQLLAVMARSATKEEIKRELHVLVHSFPNATKANLEIYGRALALDVIDLQPTIEAMVVACMVLRRTSKFLPTISEVLSWVDLIDEYVVTDRMVLSALPGLVERGTQASA
jgi:hypothetical protein